jgi:hypothetical protein
MKRAALRRLGYYFMLIGLVLALLAFYLLSTTMVNCPNAGCSQGELWSIYGPYDVLLGSGVLFFAFGVVMVIASYLLPQPQVAPV